LSTYYPHSPLGGIANHHHHHQLHPTSPGGQIHSHLLLGGQQQQRLVNNSTNLMRLRFCPLGHSDPQIYTYTQTPFYVSTTAASAAGLLGSGTPATAIPSGRYSAASGGRRSFLSASPQAGKFQVSFSNPINLQDKIIF
jgi:hypothetical protein